MPINPHTGLPKRHPMLYILTLVIIAIMIDEGQAKPFHDYPYQSSPRLLQNCETKWIGSPYNIKLAPICQNIWSQLTREQLLDAPYIP